jgi:acyl dehydratase
MTQIIVDGVDGVCRLEGQDLGHSPWVEVTQEQVDLFAEATGDDQWVHVDVERSRSESPFGGPIAHGYLTLSLIPRLLRLMMEFRGFKMGVLYGCNRVRFPAPVPVGSRVRADVRLDRTTRIEGGVEMEFTANIRVEGARKPACVAAIELRRYL